MAARKPADSESLGTCSLSADTTSSLRAARSADAGSSLPSRAEKRRLWERGAPGPDLRPGTREHALFAGFPAFLADPALGEFARDLFRMYARATITTRLLPCFSLSDERNYTLTRLRYSARGVEVAYGLYQEVLDTGDDAQFRMFLVAQLLELLRPGVTIPDSTSAALVRHAALLNHPGTRGLLATENRYIRQQLAKGRIEELLRGHLTSPPLSPSDKTVLREALFSNLDPAALCNLDDDTADTVLDRRLELLTRVYPAFQSLTKEHLEIRDSLLYELWDTFIPLAEWIIARAAARSKTHPDEAYLLGLSGPQGSGKTTVNQILTLLLTAQRYRTAGFSIDDLYSTHREREKLKAQCPYYRFRGPPGTHDVKLGRRVIRDLRHGCRDGAPRIPVFDKSLHGGTGDRLPRNRWQLVRGRVRIIILDGWFLGAKPVDPRELDPPINDVEASARYDDADGTFRHRINTELAGYEPLFEECDDLLVLHVPNLQNVYCWRQAQETKLRAAKGTGMDASTVREFVDYCLPTTERYALPLGHDPGQGPRVVLTIGDDHRVRRLKRFEAPLPSGAGGYLSPAREEAVKASFSRPAQRAVPSTGTAVIVLDGVGLAPLNKQNPLYSCETPTLDALASASRAGAADWTCPAELDASKPRLPLPPALPAKVTVLGTAIRAASVELGLKKGQPGDSSVGHSSLAMGGYLRKYIGVIWDAIEHGTFADNPAIRVPLQHVLENRGRYPQPKLHIWGMCSRGYIHSDVDMFYAILELCAARGFRKEEVVIHVVTDGKDVPKDTAADWVRELELVLRQRGIGVIGTICGRDGWLCNRDPRFVRTRNAPAAQCIISGQGVLPDAPDALEAIKLSKQSEAGREHRDDIDRFIEPTHIAGVHSQVESGDAMLCFNLREDRSILFPEGFIFPLVDRGELQDFLYATLIDLRTLRKRRPYHVVGFREMEPGPRAPIHLVRAGLIVRSFAESEKGGEVSKTYVGGDLATMRKDLGRLSALLQIAPEQYPTSPMCPLEMPEMRASQVADLINRGIGEGVALFANLCNGDVIGHYGDGEATRQSMRAVDTQLARVIQQAQEKGVILLITADHGCVETWGPMHSANPVPFYAVFPRRHREAAASLIVGTGVKALTDVEPTRFSLLGIPQPGCMTGDSILIPDVRRWSDEQVTYALLAEAARNSFALLRRCPDKGRMRQILAELSRHRDRDAVRMFVLRLQARLSALRRTQCPFIGELSERIPPDLRSATWPVNRAARAPGAPAPITGDSDADTLRSVIPRDLHKSVEVLRTTNGTPQVLINLEALPQDPAAAQAIREALAGRTQNEILAQGALPGPPSKAIELAQAVGATRLILDVRSVMHPRPQLDWKILGKTLRQLTENAAKKQVKLLLENCPADVSPELAAAPRIGSILEKGWGLGLALNVDNALGAGVSARHDQTNGLGPYLDDRIVRSHIEVVRISRGNNLSGSIVRFLEAQGLDAVVIVEKKASVSVVA